jgi:hypothetical protein
VKRFDAIGYSGDITWPGGDTGDFFVSGGNYRALINVYPLTGYAFDPERFKNDITVENDNVAEYVRGPDGCLKKIQVSVQSLPGFLAVTFDFNSLP